MKTCWVLTYSVNAYDQYGEYFLAVFAEKPTAEKLHELLYNNSVRGSDLELAIRRLQVDGYCEAAGDAWYLQEEVML